MSMNNVSMIIKFFFKPPKLDGSENVQPPNLFSLGGWSGWLKEPSCFCGFIRVLSLSGLRLSCNFLNMWCMCLVCKKILYKADEAVVTWKRVADTELLKESVISWDGAYQIAIVAWYSHGMRDVCMTSTYAQFDNDFNLSSIECKYKQSQGGMLILHLIYFVAWYQWLLDCVHEFSAAFWYCMVQEQTMISKQCFKGIE